MRTAAGHHRGRIFLSLLAGLLASGVGVVAGQAQNQDDEDPTAAKAVPRLSLPTLTVGKGASAAALELRSLSVDVRLVGRMAETVLELGFYNHTKRQQEGEFVLQLPPEATVSTYALEVNGRMRAGVAVEKGKARNAYESIKRRRVDPGLVEREAGNVYRTRIFPIEAESIKRVRIGFIHPLGDEGRYELPLQHGKLVMNFSCTVSGVEEKPVMEPAPKGQIPTEARAAGPGVWEWEGVGVTMGNTLLRATPNLGKQTDKAVARQADGSAHFLLQGQFGKGTFENPRWESNLRKPWRQVRLLWDGSFSGRWRDHEREYAALNRLWEWIGDCEVTLQVVGSELGEEQKFLLKGKGGGEERAKLEKVLKSMVYDGAADFSKIKKWRPQRREGQPQSEGVTLLVSDGKVGSPLWAPAEDAMGEHSFLMLSAGVKAKVDPALMRACRHRLDLDKAVAVVSAEWWQHIVGGRAGISVKLVGGLQDDKEDEMPEWDVVVSGELYRVSGWLPADFSGEIEVDVASKGAQKITRDDVDEAELFDQETGEKSRWNFLRRVWAQNRLSALEREADPKRIQAFAEAERLVSDYTSLIVLEMMSDHVRYRIPPPEPSLLDEYNRQIGTGQRLTQRLFHEAWGQKLVWHRTEFPWIDENLVTEMTLVAIWAKASRAAFPKAKLNAEEVESYEDWLERAHKLSKEKEDLTGGPELRKWTRRISKQVEELGSLRQLPPVKPEDGKLHVSVRGFVSDRGLYAGEWADEEPLTLRRAVDLAGGPNRFGSYHRVYLYRDAQRTGYNLLSTQYIDVPLQWGDMVVVEGETDPYGSLGSAGPVDPFAAPASLSAGAGAGGGAPVFEETGSNQVPVESFGRPFGPMAGGQRKEPIGSPVLLASIADSAPTELPSGVDQSLLKALRDHKDPVAHYRKLLAGEFGKGAVSVASIIEIGRVFFDRDLDDFGWRVLANLTEIRANRIEAIREMAYWLAEFGRSEQGVEFLEALAAVAPDESTRALLHYDHGRISDEAKPFGLAAQSVRDSAEISALGGIALTEYYGRGGKQMGKLAGFTYQPMASDVRLVVTSVGGDFRLTINDPSALSSKDIFDRLNHGGRQVGSDRVQEYQMRRAFPGRYKSKLGRMSDDVQPVTVRADFFLHWGGGASGAGEPEHRSMTFLFDGRELQLPDLTFGWDDEEEEEEVDKAEKPTKADKKE